MSVGNGNGPRGGAVATRPGKRDFLAVLEASREGIASMVPNEAQVNRIVRIVRTAWNMDGKIRDCRDESIIGAVMKACELGLDPAGARKHCYLIPYAGECTLQVSYMGMLELAHRSGCFRAIEARLVHDGDTFRHEYNPEPVVQHVPGPKSDDPSVTHAYAYARLTSGALVVEVMARDEIERIRRTAKAGNVWASYWGEMAKKTVIKRLLKRQPSSVELAEAIEHDNDQYEPGGTVRVLGPSQPGVSRSAQLGALLDGASDSGSDEEPPTDRAIAPPQPQPRTPGDDDDAPWDLAK